MTLVAWSPPGTKVYLGIVVPQVTTEGASRLIALGATECGETFTRTLTRSGAGRFGLVFAPDNFWSVFVQHNPRCLSGAQWYRAYDVEPGSPAAQAGIRPGDFVSGIEAAGSSPTVTVRVMRPLPGVYNLDPQFVLSVLLASRPQ
jgi:hypothetical protein